ncbi:MAG: rhodanese-like domain-containing protein [Verrucomicrobiota bacterium]
MTLTAEMTMAGLLEAYPGAQRALFRKYHIGGCASCGFRPDETLAGVCERNGGLDPEEVLENIRAAHEQDEQIMLSPGAVKELLDAGMADIFDIRTHEEYEAVHIAGTRHFNQQLMQETLATAPKDRLLVLLDHTGTRSLDAAAYFAGHGFTNVHCLRGGIDTWSVAVDPSLPRYTLE